MKLEQVAEMFSTSTAQVYALVRRGDLLAIKLGGRGQWRVEQSEIEAYVERMMSETKQWLESHPFHENEPATESDDGTDPDTPPQD